MGSALQYMRLLYVLMIVPPNAPLISFYLNYPLTPLLDSKRCRG